MSFQSVYKNIFSEVPGNDRVNKLVEMTEKYPYFDFGHLLLLKYTDPGDAAYPERAAKAGLFFQNGYQLGELMELHELEEPLITGAAISPYDNSEDQHEEKPIENELPRTPVSEIAGSNMLTEEPVSAREEDNDREDYTGQDNIPGPAIEEKEPDPAYDNQEKISAALEAGSNGGGQELVFEPLHTTDYFASQGIRLSEEQQGGDKLGKQLRSFTDWLKTMKKVHETKLPLHAAPIDRTVEHMAEKSNKEDLVLTEAMAEAYLAQGKINKAKEIYSKLSLLNPAKSSFFAAKIEQLNGK